MSDIIFSSGSSSGESSPSPRIAPGARVTLHFAILLESGEEVDTTRRRAPAVFTVGDGSLLPGFEEALFGMQAGDDAQLALAPEAAFGPHRRENVQLLARERFADLELEPGLMVSFAAADGELPGVVTRLFERTVEVDFNHPLAGRPIIFDVSILSVEDGEPRPGPGVA
ncbi:MAG: FKBP-type peptidyl-prolyl cis-trans isomerase [Pseudomonadales bacterium]